MANWRMPEDEFERQFASASEAGRLAEEVEPRAIAIRFAPEERRFLWDLRNGTTFIFPADFVQGLAGQSAEALANVSIRPSGESQYWEELDVAVTVPRLVVGFFGTKAWMQELARRGGSRTSEAKRRAVRENGKKGGRSRKRATS